MKYRVNKNNRRICTYKSVSAVVKFSLLINTEKQPTENIMLGWVEWTQGPD